MLFQASDDLLRLHFPSSSVIDSALFCPSFLIPSVVHRFSLHWMGKLGHNLMDKPALTEIGIIKIVQIMDFVPGTQAVHGRALVCCCADSTYSSDRTRTLVDEQNSDMVLSVRQYSTTWKTGVTLLLCSILFFFSDRASWYNLRQWPTWYTIALFYNTFFILFYMFRALYAHHQEVALYWCSIWYLHSQ